MSNRENIQTRPTLWDVLPDFPQESPTYEDLGIAMGVAVQTYIKGWCALWYKDSIVVRGESLSDEENARLNAEWDDAWQQVSGMAEDLDRLQPLVAGHTWVEYIQHSAMTSREYPRELLPGFLS